MTRWVRYASETQTIGGNTSEYLFGYTYWLNDAIREVSYPSGRTLKYDVDDAGRINKISALNQTYADMTTATAPWAPDGRLAKTKLGNNLWETREYHTPDMATLLKFGTLVGLGDRLQLDYTYSATSNNGNLLSHVMHQGGQTWTQKFSYDPLNRVQNFCETTASDCDPASPSAWGQKYDYDRFGNRWVTASSLAEEIHEPTVGTLFNAANNRLTTADYDPAGNMKSYDPRTASYDAENRIVSLTSASSGNANFAYDGEGRRVKKVWTPNGGTTATTYYVYDAHGNVAAEYNDQTLPAAATSYVFTDLLGSVRAVTSSSGSLLECDDYSPFGRLLGSGNDGRPTGCYPTNPDLQLTSKLPDKFTGKERDSETGLDNFGARYFSGAQGRFTSPDPLLNSGRPWNPQTWNRYAYALNNPLKFNDPTGMYEWGACDWTPKECANYRQQFKAALDNLKQARDSFDKKSREYKRLDAALSAYGKENEKNGVTVGFGALAGTTAGRTTPLGDLKSFAVTLDPAKWSKDLTVAAKFLASDVGHEGTQVSDFRQAFAGNRDPLSDFSVEYRGYETSAFAFQGLFTPRISSSPSVSFGGVTARTLNYGGSIIWNSSWSAADKAAIQSRDVGITNAVKSIYGHAETIPHNPWEN